MSARKDEASGERRIVRPDRRGSGPTRNMARSYETTIRATRPGPGAGSSAVLFAFLGRRFAARCIDAGRQILLKARQKAPNIAIELCHPSNGLGNLGEAGVVHFAHDAELEAVGDFVNADRLGVGDLAVFVDPIETVVEFVAKTREV